MHTTPPSNRKSIIKSTVLPAVAAFCVYTCMFAFRKPFTIATFDANAFLGIDYKIWLVLAQTLGYTLSKFYGIRFIAQMGSKRRAITIVFFIFLAWLSLLLFAIIPPPYNITAWIFNGFPLGMIYGLVFSYLEGRKTTEILGAVLATSFIFASGFTQSAGKYIMVEWEVNEWWMPAVTGAVFFLPLILFTALLHKTPPPTADDIMQRTARLPMHKKERKAFLQKFAPGLALLVLAYIMLTVIREYRSNFAANIWNELGQGGDISIFTRTELPASLITLLLLSLLFLIKKNMVAFMVNHYIIMGGFVLCILATVFYQLQILSAFWWMTAVGMGMYMGYVPFNAMLFDRMIASFKYVSNAGFVIYVADSAGYLGSDLVLIIKNFSNLSISWSSFFVTLVLYLSAIGFVLVGGSAIYFKKKYRHF